MIRGAAISSGSLWTDGMIMPMHDIAQHLRKAEEAGADLPIAITLGNDPVVGARLLFKLLKFRCRDCR